MIAGADVVRYLLSAGGVVLVFLIASLWTFVTNRSRRSARVILAIAIAFTVASLYGFEVRIARLTVGSLQPFKSTDVAAGKRTALVILGSGSVMVNDWDGRSFGITDKPAMSRVLEASRVFDLIDPALVISSGGDPHPQWRRTPGAETMRTALVLLGVPADRIVVETQSQTTRDEAIIVAPMLKAYAIEQVVLVTSETHMRRSLATFRAVGVNAIPAMALEFSRTRVALADLWMPTTDGLAFASANAHEALGVIYYWLRGWMK